MTKTEAQKLFRANVMPGIFASEKGGFIDHPMRCEAWNNFTDALCKNGDITMKQYESWDTPF